MKLIGLLILIWGLLIPGFSEEVKIEVSKEAAVNQREFPDSINGCGPASILNLLTFGRLELQAVRAKMLGGDDATRMRFLVDRLFQNRKSVVYPRRQRWGVHGVASADLATGINELLEESGVKPLRASYLDRKPGEGNDIFQERIFSWMERSIKNGIPPILSLRSYVVRYRDGKKDPAWETTHQHFVTLTGITAEGGKRVGGFPAAIIDSNGPKLTEIHLYVEPNGQPFRAMKGVIEENRWLDGQPYLLVLAPEVRSLFPADLEWSERFLIVADFLIGDF